MNSLMLQRALLLATLALIIVSSPSILNGFVALGHSWGSDTVRYYVNPRNKWVSEGAATSAIQTAAAGWSNQSRANIQLAYAGQTTGSSLTQNYKNEVFFRDAPSSSGNVAEAWYWWDGSGRLVDADLIFYEGSFQFFTGSGCSNGIYIENVAIHEFGHALGLRHSDVPGVTMQPAMQSYCDTSQLTLEPDDIAGIEAIYPPLSGGSANTAPLVSIASPRNDTSLAEGSAVAFAGAATDTQDGNLTPNLRWTSSLVGPIGSGGSFSKALPVGTHVITAAVTDSGGLSATLQITVTVAPLAATPSPSPVSATLTVRGYKVKGMQKVDLSWKGLTATSVDIYRNGAIVTTTANDGAMTDPIDNRGNGSYSYKVCAAGSTTCSNQVSVTF